MHADYADIISRLGEPLWWDEVCAPRYEPFKPEDCNNIYAQEAMLIEIRCQDCGRPFLVADTWDTFDQIQGRARPSAHAAHGHAEWGDPPRHGCVGDTMTSESVRIVEFWKNEALGWVRAPEYEKPTSSWWAAEY